MLWRTFTNLEEINEYYSIIPKLTLKDDGDNEKMIMYIFNTFERVSSVTNVKKDLILYYTYKRSDLTCALYHLNLLFSHIRPIETIKMCHRICRAFEKEITDTQRMTICDQIFAVDQYPFFEDYKLEINDFIFLLAKLKSLHAYLEKFLQTPIQQTIQLRLGEAYLRESVNIDKAYEYLLLVAPQRPYAIKVLIYYDIDLPLKKYLTLKKLHPSTPDIDAALLKLEKTRDIHLYLSIIEHVNTTTTTSPCKKLKKD